jgi:hypothetical protein
LYFEQFVFSDNQVMNSRKVYSIIGVFSYVGGIISSLVIIIGVFLLPFSELSFRMKAVSELYLSKIHPLGNLKHSEHIKFSSCDKFTNYFSFLCCCCRKSQMQIDTCGSNLLEKEIDAIDSVLRLESQTWS